MESKLKALKVVDLKDILAKAEVAIQGKANKPDLIAKILASPEARKVYEQQYGSPSAETALDTPAPVSAKPASTAQTNSVQTPAQAEPASETKPVSVTKPVPPVASTSTPAPSSPSKAKATEASAPPAATVDEDEDLKKRKARAERFGIPLVEPTKPKEPKAAQPKKGVQAPVPAVDPETLEKRAKRFGLTNTVAASATTESKPAKGGKDRGNKRPAPVTETVDAEELERRKKRAERFGTQAATVKA